MIDYLRRFKSALSSFFAEENVSSPEFAGILGDHDGIVETGDPGIVYMTLLNGQVTRLLNRRVSNRPGRYVVAGYDSSQPGILQVLYERGVYGTDVEPYLPNHHKTHEYPSADTVWVDSGQFMPLLTLPYSGYIVQVFGGWVRRNDGEGFTYVESQTVDLESYVPTSGALYVLIDADSDGVLSVVEGSTVASIDVLTGTDIPAPDNIMVSCVRLFDGQIEIKRDDEANDIIDLRFSGSFADVRNYFDYIDFNTAAVYAEVAGRMGWAVGEYTIQIVTGLGPVLQVGQELYTIVYNGTGAQIDNATAVYPVGAVAGRPSVAEADSVSHVKIAGIILVATMDIPNGEIGIVVTQLGKIRGIDTSSFSVGETLWIASTGNGILNNLTNVKPVFPDYVIQVGGVTISDALDGEIEVAVSGSATDTVQNFWNGVFRENFDFRATSDDGVNVIGSLEPANGHDDMTMMFSDGFTMLDTAPAATIALTPGTDESPQSNFVYIPQSTKVLTVSTSDWPVTAEHIKVAEVYIPSALGVKHHGVFGNQNVNDEIQNTNTGQGHLAHIGERLMVLGSQYWSGVENFLSGVPTDGYISHTAGVVYQRHRQTVPIFDMTQYAIDAVSVGSKTFTISDDGDLSSTFTDGRLIQINDSTGNDKLFTIASTNYSAPDFVITVEETIPDATVDGTIGDSVFIVNDSVTTYLESTNLVDDLDSDSSGATLNNRWFSFVVWASNNKSGEPHHVFVNLPSGSYTSEASAIADALNYANTNIPFSQGRTGFLLGRFTCRLSPSGLTYNGGDAYQILLGDKPGISVGGGSGGGATTFLGLTDTPSAYTSQSGYIPVVNSGETALEFISQGGIPSGTTLPVGPTEGQLFLHKPTGRSILYQYIGAAWYAIIAHGSSTMYVDGASGTDSQEKGFGTGADAFATIQYAIDQVAGMNSGDVVINIAAGTYTEDLVIQGKRFTGAYTLSLIGTKNTLDTITAASGVTGTGATQGSVTRDSGTWTSNQRQHDFIEGASGNNDGTIRLIDSNTTTIATIVGTWVGSISASDTFEVFENTSIVSGNFSLANGQKGVVFSYIDFDDNSSAHSITDASVITINSVRLMSPSSSTNVSMNLNGMITTNTSYIEQAASNLGVVMQGASIAIFNRTKIYNSAGGSTGVFIRTASTATLGLGSIVDGWNVGFYAERNAVGTYGGGTSTTGNQRVRNCTTGARARNVSSINAPTNVSYSGNTTDENAESASYGYIG